MAKTAQVIPEVSEQSLALTTPEQPLAPTMTILALSEKELIAETLQANAEGIPIKFETIKIPSGGVTVFEVIDDDGRETNTPEIKGVIVDFQPVKAYWESEYTGEKNPPTCSSNDCKQGEGSPAGLCKECPFNEFGSDPKGGKGKACKDLIRLFILTEDSMLPKRITIPPTSRKNYESYMNFLIGKVKPYYGVVTAITLTKAVSGGGIKYSQTAFNRVADLTAAERAGVRSFANQLKPAMRAVGIDEADYTVEAAPVAYKEAEAVPSGNTSNEDMW